mmetsp:Transcript_45741/g.55516  ORF Transcript_45741/g.55516 Transcript_45741/m.55516 type:complete len:235 (+) Transcript_45741:205-909(+)
MDSDLPLHGIMTLATVFPDDTSVTEFSNSEQTKRDRLNARLMQNWLVIFRDLPLHDIIELVTLLPNNISLAEFLIRKKMLTYGRWADMKKNWKCGEDVQGDTDNVIVSGLWNKKRVYFKKKKLSKNFVEHAGEIAEIEDRFLTEIGPQRPPCAAIRVKDLPSYHPERVKLRTERVKMSKAIPIRVEDLPSYHPKRVKLRMETLYYSGALDQPNSLEREALNQPKNKSSRGCGIS